MEAVEIFLETHSGHGSGNGHGDGYGDGYGDGSGHGSGYGHGNGYGDGHGYGHGSGVGNGDGYGYGHGYGNGYGDGYGSGYGYGHGYGYGDANGISAINDMSIYRIDGVHTVIAKVKGDIARGWNLKSDLTLDPCYIAKQDNLFAHGITLREAMDALEKKLFSNIPEEERIEAFLDAVKDGPEYPARLFFDWHGKLTGSCQMGRKTFVENHGIDLDKDTMTLRRFLQLTREAYGEEIIRKIEDIIK